MLGAVTGRLPWFQRECRALPRGAMSLYAELREDVNRLAARLAEYYAEHLVCRAGCSVCCGHDLSVFEVEACQVRKAVALLPEEIGRRITQNARIAVMADESGNPEACPLLVDDLCAIYHCRPIICRTQGLPLLYESATGAMEVDYCRLNFSRMIAADDLAENHLVPLDHLNERLVLANLAYCRRAGIKRADSGRRLSMSRIIFEL